MPTNPNADTTLSGSTGITKANLVNRVLRRLDDNPYVDTFSGTGVGGAITAADATLTVPSDATKKYQVGGQIDFVEDGTFETVLILTVPTTTTITVLRGHRGSTASTHAVNARGRYMGRWQPLNTSEVIDDILDALWPELFDVRHVDYPISTSVSPELWFVLPSNTERVTEVYQRTLSTPVDIRVPQAWGGPYFIDSDFLGGSNVRAVQVYGTAINSPDNRLHAIYLARLALANLTTEQIAILTYQAAGTLLESGIAGESKPDRRPTLGTIASPMEARNVFLQQAEILKRKEQERLMEYLPRRNRIKFRGGRHYADNAWTAFHPVRPY